MVGSNTASFAESTYVPKDKFDASHNLFAGYGFSPEDYRKISKDASADFVDKLTGFCESRGYSYAIVPHADFVKYEKSDLNFRQWYEQYSAERGMDPHPDTCIVAPRIKKLSSCHRKGKSNIGSQRDIDSVTDYLAGMIVVMKKRPDAKRNRDSLRNLGDLMTSVERAPFTLGHKNYFHSPHDKTGFRAHKSLIAACLSPNSEFGIWIDEFTPALAQGDSESSRIIFPGELKIEHESLMDIDKLTRSFIDIGRAVNNAVMQYGMASIGKDDQDVVISKITARIERREEASDQISKLLYDHVCASAGFNAFLDPRKHAAFAPKDMDEILATARHATNRVIGGGDIARILNGFAKVVNLGGARLGVLGRR